MASKDFFQLNTSNNTMDFIKRFNSPLQLKKGKQYKWHYSTWKLTILMGTVLPALAIGALSSRTSTGIWLLP